MKNCNVTLKFNSYQHNRSIGVMYIELVCAALLFVLSSMVFLVSFNPKYFKRKQDRHSISRLKQLPGPKQFPVVGSLPAVLYRLGNVFEKTSSELLKALKDTWGSPLGLRIGSINAVIIDDINTAKKLMSSEDWSNRLDDNPIWYKRSFNSHYGLLISNGESWKEMRRFVHKALTRHGFGRTRALEMIHEIEILNFFNHLNKLRSVSKSGEVVEIQGLFNVSTFNILWKMVAGSRFAYNNEELIKMIKLLEEFAHGVHPKELGFLAFPFLSHFQKLSGFAKFIENHQKMQDFFLNIITERRRTESYKEKQESFIDVFLQEIDNHKEQNSLPNYYTDEQFVMVLVDLFVTGFVPTASCLEFLVMFLILDPEIQRKCQEEIDTVIGRNRFPSINDNEKMPYTQAVCLEVLRHVTFIPMTTRSATRDTQIDDYFIPKGTIAALNIYGMHHDKKIWDEPEKFKPERFLDKHGRLRRQDELLAFGTGKRVCPAEVFARVSTFTYFTYLLQKYTFEQAPNCPLPDPTPKVGMGNYAKPFRCVVRERQLVSSTIISQITPMKTVLGKIREREQEEEDIGTFV